MEEAVSEEEPPGGTPLFRADRLGKNLRLNNLFVKFEGANATGTQKDRISRLHVLNAINNGYDTVAVATCGNYGASLSHFASMYGVKSVVAVPSDYAGSRITEIGMNGAGIIRYNGRYEESVEYLSDISRDNSWYDANPGSMNSALDSRGYSSIAYEIVEQLGHAPEYVSVPVGNGTTLYGIFMGFRELRNRGITEAIPRMIAAGSASGSPVVHAWKAGDKRVPVLEPASIMESTVNEPLIAYRSLDGQHALDAIYESGGYAAYVTDSEMVRYSAAAERLESLSVLPASASAIAAVHRNLAGCCRESEIVIVLTGRNHI